MFFPGRGVKTKFIVLINSNSANTLDGGRENRANKQAVIYFQTSPAGRTVKRNQSVRTGAGLELRSNQ